MSCNCGAKHNNKVPCCCSQGTPLVCTTTTCASAQVCNQTVESDCVIYTGPNISCAGVTTGMTVTQVLNNILKNTLIKCNGGDGEHEGTGYFKMERSWESPPYVFTLNSMILNGVEYANGQTLVVTGKWDLIMGISLIDGLPYIMNVNDWLNSIPGVATSGFVFYDDMHVIYKPTRSSTYVIQIHVSFTNPNNSNNYYYTSQYGFSINTPSNIGGTYNCQIASSPIVPQARCTAIGTAAYYEMERTWYDCISGGYTFTLNSLTLNGVEYSIGQTLTVGNFENIIVGKGILDGLPYVMNINDWLSEIAVGTGFLFYDNMSTIDIPLSSSTYDIQILRVSNATGIQLHYRWFKLSDGTTGFNFPADSDPDAIPDAIPYGGTGWICSSPIVTTTTTLNHITTGFKIINNSSSAYVTDLIVNGTNSDIYISLPVNPGQTKSSIHNGFVGAISFTTNRETKIKVMVDRLGNGNFIEDVGNNFEPTTRCFNSPHNYTVSWNTQALLSYSNINVIIYDGPPCN